MFKSKLSKVIVSLLRRVLGVTRSGAKRLMRAMLRSLMAMGRRARLPVAGFVLPTVTMVLLVVILLTVAITLRSFDRGNMARNVRVNQQVLAAATPALDRAKAKIEYMLREDPQRPTATPSDAEMYRIMSSTTPNDFYTFGDEQRLILRADLNDSDTTINTNDNPEDPLLIDIPARENEALNTAWRYPVDTNNDGKFDTVTLYGIYFRTPKSIAGPVQTGRARQPLDARTPPMQAGNLNPACTQGEGTVASLVGDSGWERITGRLQKSFFVYTVNVPITPQDLAAGGLPTNAGQQYQAFQGTPSISALEYQQDQSRIPLSNNAVVYEDDLDISPGPPLNLNGRILTNSNLLVSGLGGDNNIRLFQVSSKPSCFYNAENSKIVVAGNVVNGWSGSDTPRNDVQVHLFKSTGISDEPNTGAPVISDANQSVSENSLQVLYNNDAYTRRLNALVKEQEAKSPTTDPDFVTLATQPPKSQTRIQALEDYFKERLRKVPFSEPPDVIDPATAYTVQDSGNNSLRPIPAWSLPTPSTFNGTTEVSSVGGPTNLNILPDQLASRDPSEIDSDDSEDNLGERVIVGNNLPAQRWNPTNAKFTSDEQQVDGSTLWADGGVRTRAPQVTKLADVGATDRGNGRGEAPPTTTPPNPAYRDGFWERVAAEIPRTDLDAVGGLRIITSAGVYDRTNSFLPPPSWIDIVTNQLKSGPASIATPSPPVTNYTYDDPETGATEQYPVVWPDSMPMSPLGPGSQVWNNGSLAAGTIAPGTWGTWDSTWSTQVQPAPALPDATGLPPADNNGNFVNESATTSKFARGDLRMRASAVYHYAIANGGYDPVALAATPGAQPTQVPLACVSSYYDPSNASTARNITTGGLSNVADLDVSGEPAIGTRQAIIGSNNGITYGPPGKRGLHHYPYF